MSAKEGEKQITLWLDERERNQFQSLCKTMGWSVSGVLRGWIKTALEEQSINVPMDGVASPPDVTAPATDPVDTKVFKEVLHRLDDLERQIPDFNIDDLERMKLEVLDDDFGSMKHRVSVIETQVQALGGSIAWEKAVKDADTKPKL